MAKEPDWSEDRRCYGESTKEVKGSPGKAKRCEKYVRVGNYCRYHVAQDNGQLHSWEEDPVWGLGYCNKPTRNGFCHNRPGVHRTCQHEYYHSKFNLEDKGPCKAFGSDSNLEHSNPIEPDMPPPKPPKKDPPVMDGSTSNLQQSKISTPQSGEHDSGYPLYSRKILHPRRGKRNIAVRDGTHKLGFYPHGQQQRLACHQSSKALVDIADYSNDGLSTQPPSQDRSQTTVNNGMLGQPQKQGTKRITIRKDTDDTEEAQNADSPHAKDFVSRNISHRPLKPMPSEAKARQRQPLQDRGSNQQTPRNTLTHKGSTACASSHVHTPEKIIGCFGLLHPKTRRKLVDLLTTKPYFEHWIYIAEESLETNKGGLELNEGTPKKKKGQRRIKVGMTMGFKGRGGNYAKCHVKFLWKIQVMNPMRVEAFVHQVLKTEFEHKEESQIKFFAKMDEYGPKVPCTCNAKHRDFFYTTSLSLRWLRRLIVDFVLWDFVEVQKESNRIHEEYLESREQNTSTELKKEKKKKKKNTRAEG
ncbi:hypothetical protein EV426DRAFT_195973 [Tirmania nivea]|nr:hypothetical protein EV426DRAFT_195973 [Tirmania nivea]